MNKCVVGQIRPSQLLWTYGPGSLIDLPNLSVITMGLDMWREIDCPIIDEPRLLRAVQKAMGKQVESLRMPPTINEEDINPYSIEALQGVPVKPFPRWLRCVKCGLLAEYDSGLFEIKEDRYKRPEHTHFVHKNCPHGNDVDAVPARFLLACPHGHVDDFPWRWFVHGGATDCRESLHFFERGASLQTENLWVKCECGAAKSLVFAFGKDAKHNLPGCRGRHPQLDKFEDCKEQPRTILLGASNGWFPIYLSALAIPTQNSLEEEVIEKFWDSIRELSDKTTFTIVISALKVQNPEIKSCNIDDLWCAFEKKKNGHSASKEEYDLKMPEWKVLSSKKPVQERPHFVTSKVDVPADFIDKLSEVLLLERLRQVNALIGYTRIEASSDMAESEEKIPRGPISKEAPTWVPACEVHGEGIFIRFDEEVLHDWEKQPAVISRNDFLFRGHQSWRVARKLDPCEEYPGVRFIMLHTFAHLIIREFALECGYNAASIQERIYAKKESAVGPMAGVLLYTASPDSDGTLGGLVNLGRPESLNRVIKKALMRARICSSDPLCSSHNPGSDRSLHGAACHACSFAAETSCEIGNKYLDRCLVIPTIENGDAAFFSDIEKYAK